MRYFIFLIIFSLIVSCSLRNNTVAVNRNINFLRKVQALESIDKYDGWSEEAFIAAMRLRAESLQPDSYMPAILELWKMRDFEYLELLWWKSEDPNKRLMVLACYYVLTIPNSDFRNSTLWPNFKYNTTKFKDDIEVCRVKEVEYIISRKEKFENSLLFKKREKLKIIK
jgi:hypothetical protein